MAKNKKLNNKNKSFNFNTPDISDNFNTFDNKSENPFKIGDIIRALAGRDEDRMFIVVGVMDKDYVLIANGRSRRVDSPKKKKIRHIKLLREAGGDFNIKDLKGGRFTNLIVRNIITEYYKTFEPNNINNTTELKSNGNN